MIRAIFVKEFKSYLRSPISYFVLGLFTLVVGWIFFNQLVYFVNNIQKIPVSMRNQYDFANEVIIKLYGNVNFLLLFIIPIISMKSFSEEYRNQTMDLYFSSPISDYELVIGKYLAVVAQGTLLILTTAIYPLFLSNLNISDTSFIYTGYLGLFFNVLCFSGLSCLASSLGTNQIFAALAGFIFVLFAWMTSMLAQMTSNFVLSEFFKFISVNHHFENFVKGNISLSDFSFYISFIILSLLILKKRIESRRWI